MTEIKRCNEDLEKDWKRYQKYLKYGAGEEIKEYRYYVDLHSSRDSTYNSFNLHRYLYHEKNASNFHCDEEDIALVGTFVPASYSRQDYDPRILPEYKEWRKKVFKRDNYTCRECGEKRYLQAHHIKQVALFPELMFDVDNGETLCKECHQDKPVLRRDSQ